MRLELSIIAGKESKAFLADLAVQVDRLEKLAAIATGLQTQKKTAKATEIEEDEDHETEQEMTTLGDDMPSAKDEDLSDDSDLEDDDFSASKKTKKTDAARFDEELEDIEEAPKSKRQTASTKEKKLTKDDVNDACKKHFQALVARGQAADAARKAVVKLLHKHFAVKSITDLDPEQYAEAVKILKVKG